MGWSLPEEGIQKLMPRGWDKAPTPPSMASQPQLQHGVGALGGGAVNGMKWDL